MTILQDKSKLFEPVAIGRLHLRNRLMRSATAERMADFESGAPLPTLAALYRTLAEGGVGLIVTGHAYVARGGKAHPEMAALDRDGVIPLWRGVIRPAQEAGARVMVQINHSGANCDPTVTPDVRSPSGVATNDLALYPAVMSDSEIEGIVADFGQAARRAQEAGFDGVQIHGAHGYLTSQFLTPATNLRRDRWGGNAKRRLAFLRAVAAEVRSQVGPDYPVWIKLGVEGRAGSGLSLAEGAKAAAACRDAGIDAVEISHALGMPAWAKRAPEPAFLRMAQAVRAAVGPGYPLALVNGFRQRAVMDRTLESGVVDLISLCRPLIVQPHLPRLLREQEIGRAMCASCGQCWPNDFGEGVACHNRALQRRLREEIEFGSGLDGFPRILREFEPGLEPDEEMR